MSAIEKLIFHIKSQSATRLLLAGYCLVILLGTLLLCLPVSLQNPSQIDVFTAFFTATSSACVTGLILVDTWTHWTLFGQMVILFLIQIGGLGFMTVCIAAVSFTHQGVMG